MQIVCPRCRKPVAGADIDLPQRAAVCRSCAEVFAFAVPAPTLAPMRVYKPSDMRWSELESPGRFDVTFTPPRTAGVLMAVFAGIWLAGVLAIVVRLLASGHAHHAWFVLPHVLIGTVLAFFAAVGLRNRATVGMDGAGIQVQRKPFLRSSVTVPTADVERFAAVEQSPSRAFALRGTANRISFGVDVHTSDGRSTSTKLAFDDRAHAEFAAGRLQQMLEQIRSAGQDDTPYRGAGVARIASIPEEPARIDDDVPDEPEAGRRRRA